MNKEAIKMMKGYFGFLEYAIVFIVAGDVSTEMKIRSIRRNQIVP